MALSKTQIINALSLMSESTLQKLYSYSSQIIIPDTDLLVDVTMQQMVAKAMKLADQYFPQWTDRSQSDFGRFLIELIGLFSEKDFYYINGFANETFLSKIKNYADLFTRATEYGYEARLTTCSTVSVDVLFASGAIHQCSPGEIRFIDENGVTYTNPYAQVLTASGSNGSFYFVLCAGDLNTVTDNYNGYRFDITDNNVDIKNSLSVYINGVQWTRVPFFGLSTPTDTHYMAIPEEDGSVSLYFGDSINGLEPNIDDTITATYVRAKSFETPGTNLVVNKSDATRPALGIATTYSSTTGSLGESLEELRSNALSYKQAPTTMNTEDSVRLFLNKQAGVKRSSVVCLGNTVQYRVIPSDGTIATDAFLVSLGSLLTGLTMGYTLSRQQTTYINCGPISLDLYYLAGADPSLVSAKTKNIISDYTNPMVLAEYGQDFSLYGLLHLVRSAVPDVQNIVYTMVAGTTPANIAVGSAEIMQPVSVGDITLNLIPV